MISKLVRDMNGAQRRDFVFFASAHILCSCLSGVSPGIFFFFTQMLNNNKEQGGEGSSTFSQLVGKSETKAD